MITFKNYLMEVNLLRHLDISDKLGYEPYLGLKFEEVLGLSFFRSVSSSFTMNDNKVRIYRFKSSTSILLFDKREILRMIIILRSSSKFPSSYMIAVVVAEKSPISAASMYAELIKRFDWSFVSDEQSPGGVKIWEKLSTMPGINVFAWDPKTKEAVNTEKGLDGDHLHAVERDVLRSKFSLRPNNKDAQYAFRLVLVAQKAA